MRYVFFAYTLLLGSVLAYCNMLEEARISSQSEYVKLYNQNILLAKALQENNSIVIEKVEDGDLVLKAHEWKCAHKGMKLVTVDGVMLNTAKTKWTDVKEVCLKWERDGQV